MGSVGKRDEGSRGLPVDQPSGQHQKSQGMMEEVLNL